MHLYYHIIFNYSKIWIFKAYVIGRMKGYTNEVNKSDIWGNPNKWRVVVKYRMLYPDKPASWRLNPVLIRFLVRMTTDKILTGKKLCISEYYCNVMYSVFRFLIISFGIYIQYFDSTCNIFQFQQFAYAIALMPGQT